MLVKLLSLKSSMDKILIKLVLLLDSILRLFNIKILNLMSGILEDKKLSDHIGEIILNKLMALFGL